jgi:hypothetical protein
VTTNFGDFQNGIYADAVTGVNSRYPFDFSTIEGKAAQAFLKCELLGHRATPGQPKDVYPVVPDPPDAVRGRAPSPGTGTHTGGANSVIRRRPGHRTARPSSPGRACRPAGRTPPGSRRRRCTTPAAHPCPSRAGRRRESAGTTPIPDTAYCARPIQQAHLRSPPRLLRTRISHALAASRFRGGCPVRAPPAPHTFIMVAVLVGAVDVAANNDGSAALSGRTNRIPGRMAPVKLRRASSGSSEGRSRQPAG